MKTQIHDFDKFKKNLSIIEGMNKVIYTEAQVITAFQTSLIDKPAPRCHQCINNNLNHICALCNENPNLEKRFIKKTSKLFPNAPLILRTIAKPFARKMVYFFDSEENGKRIRYCNSMQSKNISEYTESSQFSLPTIEESPQNTWLAPWLQMPENLGMDLYELIVNFSNRDKLIVNPTKCFLKENWDKVTAIMILGDF